MVIGRKTVGSTDLALHGRDPWTHEFDNTAALAADQVIVVLSGMDMFVEESSLTEAYFAYQSRVDHEIEVAVDGGARDAASLGVERCEKLLGVDVTVLIEDLIEQC